MSITATVGVGLAPSYANLGAAAPVVLVALRLCQGFAVGGEVGGACLGNGQREKPKGERRN